MPNHSVLFSVACCLVPSLGCAQSPLYTVVPAAYATTDAISYLWIPGASCDVRQQTLVGQSHLRSVVGRSLTALEFRRTAANETYQGGTANMTVTLSTSPSRPLHCSPTFATNVGTNATTVFTGGVTLPTTHAVIGPAVPWSPPNTIRMPFQAPFVYTGGTLCIDIVGLALPGQQADWWMADAVFEDMQGTARDVGSGCGAYGGPNANWSATALRKLVPGSYADFWAAGPHWAFGLAAFGVRSTLPLPLTSFGIPSPGCNLHLASIDILIPAWFIPEVHPLLQAGPARADVEFWIPDDNALFGATMTTQWFECTQQAMSNAIEWSVAATIPAVDMTSIEGAANAPSGNVAVGHAHVLRLQHQ